MGRRTAELMVIAAALLAVLVLTLRRVPVVPSPDRPSIAPAASTTNRPSYRLAARPPRPPTAYPSAQDANPLSLLPGAIASTTDYRGGMAAVQRLPDLLATNDVPQTLSPRPADICADTLYAPKQATGRAEWNLEPEEELLLRKRAAANDTNAINRLCWYLVCFRFGRVETSGWCEKAARYFS